MTTIGIAHPGEMGGAVAAALSGEDARVVWASAGRSVDTRARAEDGGLRDVETLEELAAQSDLLLAICPPHAAVELAEELAGYRGVYVDANAIAPQTAMEVAAIVTAGGAEYVDGSIIGPPPSAAATTRLYLSGERAAELATLLSAPLIEAIALDGPTTAASAIKMVHAGWTKGSAALLLTMRAAALELGVEEPLLAEWERSQPDLAAKADRAAQQAAAKAWRWTAEMEEVALTLESAGLPDGFHRAAAEIFTRTPPGIDASGAELLASLLAALPQPAGERKAQRGGLV